MPRTTLTIGAPSSDGEDFLWWNDNIGALIDPALVDEGAVAFMRYFYLSGVDGAFLFVRTAATADGASGGSGPDLSDDAEQSDVAFTFECAGNSVTIDGSDSSLARSGVGDGDDTDPYIYAYPSGNDIYDRIASFITAYRALTAAQKATTTLTIDDGATVAIEAPTLTVNAVGTITENENAHLVLNIEGGNYDERTIAWEVDSGGGSIVGTGTTVLYLPADVDADTDVDVTATVTVTGTGTNAPDGTTATATETLTFTVEFVPSGAVAPTLTIEPISHVTEGNTVAVTATVDGGVYDDIELTWEIIEGDGEINGTGLVVPYVAPHVAEDETVTLQLTVEVSGDGTTAAVGTTATVVASVSFPVRDIPGSTLPAIAPSVSIADVGRVDRNTSVGITAIVVGGVYDTIEFAWEIVTGGGTVVGTEQMIDYISGFVSTSTRVELRVSVTVRGTGTLADDNTTASAEASIVFNVVPPSPDENLKIAAAHARHLSADDGFYAMEITHPDIAAPIRVVNATEALTIENNTYMPVAFRAQDPKDNEAEVRSSIIRMDNVGDVLTNWIDASNGGAGAEVRIMKIIRTTTANEVYWDITMSVGLTDYNSREVSIRLGDEPLIGRPGVLLRHDPVTSPGLF